MDHEHENMIQMLHCLKWKIMRQFSECNHLDVMAHDDHLTPHCGIMQLLNDRFRHNTVIIQIYRNPNRTGK